MATARIDYTTGSNRPDEENVFHSSDVLRLAKPGI
jgi:hypothetical protein